MLRYFLFSLIVLSNNPLPASDITIWFGNPDGSPLVFKINSDEEIPVWIHMQTDICAAAVHIPLSTDDRFIPERSGIKVYAPFKNDDVPDGFDRGWDVVSIFEPKPHPGRDGFTSHSLLAFMNLMKNPNLPLHCVDTCKIMDYLVKTSDADSLRGRAFEVLSEGFEDRSKGLHFSDTLGFRTFTYDAFFSQVYFVYPGDINDDLSIDQKDVEGLTLYLDDKKAIPWPDERADFNDDGIINKADLVALQNFLKMESR